MSLWGRLTGRSHADLPLDADESSRFLPWIVAAMIYLAALTLASALALDDAVERWTGRLSDRLTVQLAPADEEPAAATAETTAAERQPAAAGAAAASGAAGASADAPARPDPMDRILTLLETTPGVARAEVLPPARATALLEPWIGSALVAELPLPRIIDVRTLPGARLDLIGLRAELASIAPEATVDDHGAWVADLVSLARSGRTLAFGVMLMVLFIAVLAVVFATRSGLAVHREVIDLLHLFGARDLYIARQFARHAFWLTLRGSLLGTVLALVTLGLVSLALEGVDVGLLPRLSLSPADFLLVALLPAVTGVVAVLTGRVTVMRALARLP